MGDEKPRPGSLEWWAQFFGFDPKQKRTAEERTPPAKGSEKP